MAKLQINVIVNNEKYKKIIEENPIYGFDIQIYNSNLIKDFNSIKNPIILFDSNPKELSIYNGKCIKIYIDGEGVNEVPFELYDKFDNIWELPENPEKSNKIFIKNFQELIKRLQFEINTDRLAKCFNTVINSFDVPIYITNNEQTIGEGYFNVNNRFCELVGMEKSEILKNYCYTNNESLKNDIKSSNNSPIINLRPTLSLEEKLQNKERIKLFETKKTPLIDKDGMSFGTCHVAKEIFDLTNLTNELNMFCESFEYGVIVVDNSYKIIGCNSIVKNLFSLSINLIDNNLLSVISILKSNDELKIENDEIIFLHEFEKKIFKYNKKEIHNQYGDAIGFTIILNDITKNKKKENQLEKLAYHDSLTNLYNRHYLSDFLEENKHSKYFTYLMIDVDNFKQINDRYGHDQGDCVLAQIASELKKLFEDGNVFRMGGDEFLVVYNTEVSNDDLKSRIEYLNSKNEMKSSNISVSAGIANSIDIYYPNRFEDLKNNSDVALYETKQNGKCNCTIYGDEYIKETDFQKKLNNI